MRRTVDPVGTSRHHSDVVFGEPRGEIGRDVSPYAVEARVPTTAAARSATSSSRAGPIAQRTVGGPDLDLSRKAGR